MTPQEQDDAIARVLAGDTNAFEAIVLAHQSKVYNIALHMMGNPADAEDCAQEAFLKAYRFLPSHRADASFAGWLYRLTANVCLDALRKRSRRDEISISAENADGAAPEDCLADESPAPEEALEQKELVQAIRQGLQQLPEDFRTVLLLRELGDMSYDEIARQTGLETGTVKSRIFRARKKLADIFLSSGNFPGFYASDKKEVQ